MLERLRTATRSAHERLETALDLLHPPLSQTRFVSVLAGFRTFHAAWEPRVDALIGDAIAMEPRRRLHRLDADLCALGGQMATHPAFDLSFLTSPSAAWGSLYVMEGSTLGGLLISRALQDAEWLPAGGLSYFNPYGRRTAEMWKAFGAAIGAPALELDEDHVVGGAVATFETLQRGFSPRMEIAA